VLCSVGVHHVEFPLNIFRVPVICPHSLWSQSLFLPCSFPGISHGISGHLNLKYNILTVFLMSSICSACLIPYPQFSCHY
jgi:hypothetical protein